MRIAYIVETFPSPTEHFILSEIRGLVCKGAHLTVFAFRKTNSVPLESFSHVRVYYLPHLITLCVTGVMEIILSVFKVGFKRYGSPRGLKRILISNHLLKIIRQLKISHIHAHFGFITTDVAYNLSQVSSIPFSFTLHAQDIYLNNNFTLRERIVAAKFVITCTRQNKDYLIRHVGVGADLQHKIQVVYHGVDLSARSPTRERKDDIASRSVRILSVGRLVEKKGFVYLLKAISILKKQKFQIECCIIGEGPLESTLKLYTVKHNISHLVKFTGYVAHADIRPFLAASDIFVLPCIVADNGDRDGIPNVLLEAMAAGLPVISTKISAIPELIEHETNGLLLDQRDPISLAKAITRLSNDHSLYHKIAMNARKSLNGKFDADASVGQLLAVFRAYVVK